MNLLAATTLTLLTATPTLAQTQPTTLNGTLDSNSEVAPESNRYYNIHTFEGQAGEQITIELTSNDFDPVLGLIDPEIKIVALDNDGGEGNNARIIVTLLATGTYTITAVSYKAGQSGNYTLSWREATAEELDLAEAEQLNQQVMQLYQQGQYTEAIPLAEQALAIWEKVLGAEHPDVATSLNNLAMLYQAMGNYSGAEPLYQRSLAIREKVLGAEHPDVATSLNDLALLYRAQGNIPLATELLTRGTNIEEHNLS
ncbi:MAG: tetratricopeptide repeat protein, partial [Geitlerinemataceae cyanobacterium]